MLSVGSRNDVNTINAFIPGKLNKFFYDLSRNEFGFRILDDQNQRYGSSGNGNTFQDLRPMGHSNATVEIMTDFRGVPMRASPTVAFSGNVNIRGCASTYSDNGVTLAGNNFALADDGVSQTGHFWVSAASGTPFSASYSGRVTGASNGTYIEFRAEL